MVNDLPNSGPSALPPAPDRSFPPIPDAGRPNASPSPFLSTSTTTPRHVHDANAADVLAFDDEVDGDDLDDGIDSDSPESLAAVQERTRIEAHTQGKGSRRPGDVRTQRVMLRAWQRFRDDALRKKHIQDDIVDEHHLLVFIKHCAERPKLTRQGKPIDGTFLGAAQIKKLYLGALRVRKYQEAVNPTLRDTRPAVTSLVRDALRGRMNAALQRTENDLIDNDDAPDIIVDEAFLRYLAEDQIDETGNDNPPERTQNDEILRALNVIHSLTMKISNDIRAIDEKLERRLASLSPRRGFSLNPYSQHVNPVVPPPPSSSTLYPSSHPQYATLPPSYPNGNTAQGTSLQPGGAIGSAQAQPPQPIQLVFPPPAAFLKPGEAQFQPVFPVIFGTNTLSYTEIFPYVQNPAHLWDVWKPLKSLDKYTLNEIWIAYDEGESFEDANGAVFRKPALRQVEQYFVGKWRPNPQARKAWERFREIPEFIHHESQRRNVSPSVIITELQELARTLSNSSTGTCGLAALRIKVKAMREGRRAQLSEQTQSKRALDPDLGQGGSAADSESGALRRKAPVDSRRRKRRAV